MEQMHLLVNLDVTGYKLSIPSHFRVTLLTNHTYYNRVVLIRFVQIAGGHLFSHLIMSFGKHRQLLAEICGKAAILSYSVVIHSYTLCAV
jgi:hypothetical protein